MTSSLVMTDDHAVHNEGRSICRQLDPSNQGIQIQWGDRGRDHYLQSPNIPCMHVIIIQYDNKCIMKNEIQENMILNQQSDYRLLPSHATIRPSTFIGRTSFISSIGDFLLVSCIEICI